MSGGISDNQKVKLTTKSGNPFGFTGILSPLAKTNGVIFPYTPTIQFGYSANYGSFDITHSLYPTNYFINNPAPSISLTATFTAQDKADAEYSIAALHFFRTCTKMDYGASRRDVAGTPPPVLNFSAYGMHAKNTPVILKSLNYSLPEDTDYVTYGNNSIPTTFIVSLELGVQFPPSDVRKEFNIRSYASGSMLKGYI